MAVEIKCNKCGFKSSNPYEFENKLFRVLARFTWRKVHLCTACQTDLGLLVKKTQATFLGIEKIDRWDEHEGVL